MSNSFVPLEEYKAIKASWRSADVQRGRRFDYGTARENLNRSHEMLRQAAQEEARLVELDQRLPAGDIRRVGGVQGEGTDHEERYESLAHLLRKARSEKAHWRDYVDHYQKLAAAEPLPRRPTDPLPQDSWVGQRERVPGEDDVPLEAMAPPPDPRLPREEDPDDVGTGA